MIRSSECGFWRYDWRVCWLVGLGGDCDIARFVDTRWFFTCGFMAFRVNFFLFHVTFFFFLLGGLENLHGLGVCDTVNMVDHLHGFDYLNPFYSRFFFDFIINHSVCYILDILCRFLYFIYILHLIYMDIDQMILHSESLDSLDSRFS